MSCCKTAIILRTKEVKFAMVTAKKLPIYPIEYKLLFKWSVEEKSLFSKWWFLAALCSAFVFMLLLIVILIICICKTSKTAP